MNSTEKTVLNSIANSLEKSLSFDIEKGDTKEWYDFAQQMRHSIKSHLSTIRGLLSRPVEEEKSIEKNNETPITT